MPEPLPFPRADIELAAKLERFAMLRDTIQGLEIEKAELGAEIKAALVQGARAECELYRARLQTSRKVTYPVDRFREVYGDAATLEVSQIVNKRVRELVEAGDLDGQHLAAIGEVEERHALYLVPTTG